MGVSNQRSAVSSSLQLQGKTEELPRTGKLLVVRDDHTAVPPREEEEDVKASAAVAAVASKATTKIGDEHDEG